MRSLLSRWKRSEDAALTQLTLGKTAAQRFRGLRRSERNEAKLFLVAVLPTLSLAPFIPKWSLATDAQKLLIVLVAGWAVAVVSVGTFFVFKRLMGLARKSHD